MKKIIFLLCLVCLLGCKTRYIEIPVETIKTEYINKIQYDSIYVHDSIDRYMKGDTVFLTNFKYINKYVLKTDTLIRQDTIPVIQKVEIVKEVNRLKNWQIILMCLGYGFIIVVGYKVIKKIKH